MDANAYVTRNTHAHTPDCSDEDLPEVVHSSTRSEVIMDTTSDEEEHLIMHDFELKPCRQFCKDKLESDDETDTSLLHSVTCDVMVQ